MPSKADKHDRPCERCQGIMNVRRIVDEDDNVEYLCGRCRYSDASQVEKRDFAESMTISKLVSQVQLADQLVGHYDPRYCCACGEETEEESGDELCAECAEKVRGDN